MKILIISTLYPPHVIGGAEKAAAELAEALVHRGHVVVVITLHPGSSEVVEDRNGVRVYRLPVDNFYWPFGRKKKPNGFYRLAWHIREVWNPVAARRIGLKRGCFLEQLDKAVNVPQGRAQIVRN